MTARPHREQILRLHKAPLYSVDGFTLSAGFIEITGLVLAPDGNAERVRIEAEDGISFQWLYPLPNPGAAEYYWYWDNSGNSMYKLSIDLSATRHSGPAYPFRFLFDAPSVPKASIKDAFFVPKDLGRYQTFPSSANLSRVQTFDTISGVVVRGYSDYRRIRSLAEAYGLKLDTGRILDWGCGHGRVIRHFDELGPNVELHGIDIDNENVTWAKANLPYLNLQTGPLIPPTNYDDSSFDLVFGISVMTHLTEKVQIAWLSELKRITKTGGIVLLTFSGDTDVAFTSRELDQSYIDNYVKNGRGADLPSGDLAGVIPDNNYYKNVKVSAARVRTLCSSYFEVLDVLECMFGYQDVAVLRRI